MPAAKRPAASTKEMLAFAVTCMSLAYNMCMLFPYLVGSCVRVLGWVNVRAPWQTDKGHNQKELQHSDVRENPSSFERGCWVTS